MAGLDQLVRSAVATADRVTKTLQGTVQHQAKSATDGFGKVTPADAVERKALIDLRTRTIRRSDGTEFLATASVQFLTPVVVAHGDLITLPGGQTGRVELTEGTVDPTTGASYATRAWIGAEDQAGRR